MHANEWEPSAGFVKGGGGEQQIACARPVLKRQLNLTPSGRKDPFTTFSHRQTKLVSLVPSPCLCNHTILSHYTFAERKFENTIWVTSE